MFFILNKKSNNNLGSKQKCIICSEGISLRFNAMPEWSIEGPLCGDCYSKKLGEHYPGDHARVNLE